MVLELNYNDRKEVLQKLIPIEEQLDKINGNYGNKNNYCIFCLSRTYNGVEGIKHKKTCIISEIRIRISILKNLNKGKE